MKIIQTAIYISESTTVLARMTEENFHQYRPFSVEEGTFSECYGFMENFEISSIWALVGFFPNVMLCFHVKPNTIR